MKIFIIIPCVFLGILFILCLLLLVKTGFYSNIVYTEKDGFSFSGKITWGLFSIPLKKKKKTKKIPKKTACEKKKKKTSTVESIKSICTILNELKWIPGKVLIFKRELVWCKVALRDPMKNGIVYGSLSGALMSVIQLIVCRFKTDEYKLRVTPDFSSGDGISIKNITWVQFRPLVLIICIIYAYTKSEKLKLAVSKLMKENKEKTKKGRVPDEQR